MKDIERQTTVRETIARSKRGGKAKAEREPVEGDLEPGDTVDTAGRVALFVRGDWIVSAVAALIAFMVYVFTLQPNVGLEDSGEFITAAMHLGVPHPPGYPTWTVLSWLTTKLVPFGNVAWRVNLVSAIFGGLTIYVTCLLMSSSIRWILSTVKGPVNEKFLPGIAHIAAATGSLVLAFSDVMWSQSVIAEVYTLNAFILSCSLFCFYRYFHDPDDEKWLVLTAFCLGVGMTNHHTLLFIFPALFFGVALTHFSKSLWHVLGATILAPIGVGAVMLRRLGDFFVAVTITAMSVLAVFAYLSRDQDLQSIALKLSVIYILLSALVVLFRAGQMSWGMIGGAVVATWIGLMAYAYMPAASRTNPPMNWGFASESEGFFHAINRGQYADNMVMTIKRYLGWVNLKGSTAKKEPLGKRIAGFGRKMYDNIYLYTTTLERNLTWPVILLVFGMVMLIVFPPAPHPFRWLLFAMSVLVCLSMFQMFIMQPAMDDQSRWVGKTFFLQSYCAFAMIVAYGLGMLLYGFVALAHGKASTEATLQAWAAAALLFPLLPAFRNYEGCEQRDRWFGWMYGVDMLRDCDRNAVIFGGTDPGRFVPTYTIFCESVQPDRWKPWLGEPGDGPKWEKQHPDQKPFDRRDLYIITQNALADFTYMKYIRAHYDVTRRTRYNVFERWLGREEIYPEKPLLIPTEDEVKECFQEYVEQSGRTAKPGERITVDGVQGVFQINGLISKRIFDNNKQDHSFYIEESFPMDWYYPHSVPFGLFLKIERDPVASIGKDLVEKDRTYWNAYAAKLMANKKFLADRPARMSFSKLRCSIANIYSYRNMLDEAEEAYRQALDLAPMNAEVVFRLADLLARRGKYDEALEKLAAFGKLDPANTQIKTMIDQIEVTRNLQKEVAPLKAAVDAQPNSLANFEERMKLIDAYRRMNDVANANAEATKVLRIIEAGLNANPGPAGFDYRVMLMRLYATVGQQAKADEWLTKTESMLTAIARSNEQSPVGLDARLKLLELYTQLENQQEEARATAEVLQRQIMWGISNSPEMLDYHLAQIHLMHLAGQTDQATRLASNLLNAANLTEVNARQLAQYFNQERMEGPFFAAMERWEALSPSNAAVRYDLARMYATRHRTNEAVERLTRALELGGTNQAKRLEGDATLAPLREHPAVKAQLDALATNGN